MWSNNILIIFIVIIKLFKFSESFLITIDAHSEECFFDKVEKDTKLGLMFETVEGGFLDIDIKIVGPSGEIIHQAVRESSGRYAFQATTTGVYTYCFSNQMSTMTPKNVMFHMEIGEAPRGTIGAISEAESGHTKLEDMIRELTGTLTGVKHEQEYMNVRDKIHRSINESTNFRVVLWSSFEATVLLLMTAGQVYYLKRFFEVRRVV